MHVTHELHRLHRADQAVKSLEEKLAGPEAAEEVRASRDQAQTRLEEVQAELEQEQSKFRALERDTAVAEARQKALQKRLYGGFITNPKELEGCQTELVQCGERKEEFENQALESMMRVEELDEEVAAQSTLVAELSGELSLQEKAAEQTRQELKARLEAAQQERQTQAQRIEPDKLKLYERIRKERGTAVAEVNGTRCGGCHMDLSGKVFQEVKARDLTLCTNCGRVLHSS